MSNYKLLQTDGPADEVSLCADRELQLLGRVVERDKAAIEDLYVLYHRRLARFLMRFVRRDDLAEEVINDTIAEVWCKAADFKGTSSLSTWIMGIAYRRALKRLQPLSSVTSHENSVVELPELSTNAHQSTRELREWLEVALERLPLEQRLVFDLAYGLGHSCDEIAAIMECPASNVKSRMLHARHNLSVRLSQLAERCPSQ